MCDLHTTHTYKLFYVSCTGALRVRTLNLNLNQPLRNKKWYTPQPTKVEAYSHTQSIRRQCELFFSEYRPITFEH